MKMVTTCCSTEETIRSTVEYPLNDRFPIFYRTPVCSTCLDENPVMVVACDHCGKKANLQSHSLGDLCELCILLLSQPTIEQDNNNPSRRVALNDWRGSSYEISKSLLAGGEGIVVQLFTGPPDSLNMTVYWHSEPADIIILEEVLEDSFYDCGINPLELDYTNGLLFRLQEWDKFDTGEYLFGGTLFNKQSAIVEAEKCLQEKYAPSMGDR